MVLTHQRRDRRQLVMVLMQTALTQLLKALERNPLGTGLLRLVILPIAAGLSR